MLCVAIRDKSAGNDTIGEMWKETKIFDQSQPISDVLKWAFGNTDLKSHGNLVLTIPEPDDLSTKK